MNHSNPEGALILLKKGDREEEFYYAPTKKKSSKGGKKKDEGSKKAIKHNAETFKLFGDMKLDAPLTTDEIPDLIEKLKEQLADYEAKVADWEKNRDAMKKKIMAGEVDDEEKKEEAEAEN